jgi:signal transduction histidine kinase
VTRRLLLSYLSITALVLVLFEIPLGLTAARRERASLVAAVRHDADAVATYAAGPLGSGQGNQLQTVAAAYRAQTGGRMVVVDASGVAVADSEGTAPGRSFATRPEVTEALAGRQSSGIRYSATLGRRLVFVAVPVNPGGRISGAVRVTYPANVIDSRIRRNWIVLGAVAALILGVVYLVSLALARSVTAPLKAIEEAAERLGEGDLSARAPVPADPPELRLLAQQVNGAGAKLERLVGFQQEFVADASHQLRTPLAALRLRLEMLEGEVTSAAGEDLAGALAEVHRLSRLIDGLLVLARAEQATVRPEMVNLEAVVHDRRAAWSPVAEERAVRLVEEIPARLWVKVTPGNLEQVLDNLLANALEASPREGRIWLTGAEEDGWTVLHVTDEGPGMDAQRRQRAFDRFWRPTGSAPTGGGGFGLGLAIARRLVETDGGELDLLEAPSGGLAARIRLRPAENEHRRRSGWPSLSSRPR